MPKYKKNEKMGGRGIKSCLGGILLGYIFEVSSVLGGDFGEYCSFFGSVFGVVFCIL